MDTDIASLKAAIERLAADNASAEDLTLVTTALTAGAVSIASSGRAASSLDRYDQSAAIVTADGYVILYVDALVLQRMMESLDFVASTAAAGHMRDLHSVALARLGSAYAALGDRRAINLYYQALQITREIGDRRGEGDALAGLGSAYAVLGESRLAIDLYGQALKIMREIGDRRGEGAALFYLGTAHAAIDDSRRAIDLYYPALEIMREIGDRRGEGAALFYLGTAHAALGESRRAIDLYYPALEIVREIGDRRGEGDALAGLGSAYAALGESHRAIDLYGQALKIMREIGDRRGEGAALSRRGMANYLALENSHAAESYVRAIRRRYNEADAEVRAPTVSADDVRLKRNLNAWISNPRPEVSEVFRVSINIGTAKDTAAASVGFIEPDWGEAEFMDLIVSVSCLDCSVVPSWQELKLPRTGDSRKIDFLITARVAGDREFTVRVYLAKQMIQLQSLRFTVTVAEAQKQTAAVL
jgi:tetratricopeptide (TPR) repeat protein